MKRIFFILILFFSISMPSKEQIFQKKEFIFAYEIYDIRYCFLVPDPFLCETCLKKDMQIGRKIVFYENGEIYRENLCIPYRRKYIY